MVTKKVECKDLCDDVSFIKFQLRNVLRLRLGFGEREREREVYSFSQISKSNIRGRNLSGR